jgi:hypothetical protein
MHADTQQLLALSDGEPIDESVRRHARGCDHCQRELALLQRTRSRLRALPPVVPPPPSPRVLAASGPPSRRPGRPVFLALAACAALVALTAIWMAPRDGSSPVTPAVAVTSDPPAANDGSRLQIRSAALEREWRSLRRYSGAVQRVGYETGAARLKSRLLALDAEHLFAPAGAADRPAEDYWNQRVRLLDSLVDIERAELLTRDDGGYQVVRSWAPSGQSYR